MTSIKLKFRPHTDSGKEGALYFQVIHERVVKQVKTGFRIHASEWNRHEGEIANATPAADARRETLGIIREKVARTRRRLERVVAVLETGGKPFTAEEIVHRYKESASGGTSVFEYMERQSERLRDLGKARTSETYRQALRSFRRFRGDSDLCFHKLDADVVERYESHLRANRLSRNTTSFYMRILRCVYNRAVGEGLAAHADPFRGVYTGVDKTAKRAISLKEVRRIKELDLSGSSGLAFARDMFLLSFYLRGMSFVDIAYLRKKDLSGGYVTYIRKKTGRRLTVRWEKPMREIAERYAGNPTQYLLPIITREDGTERAQYLSKIQTVNRNLKTVARMARVAIPLSTYVARHSWASIAEEKNVPLSVISEGMGHDSEQTTRIYLAAIRNSRIDEANGRILKDL